MHKLKRDKSEKPTFTNFTTATDAKDAYKTFVLTVACNTMWYHYRRARQCPDKLASGLLCKKN
jgi:hypothetical protein